MSTDAVTFAFGDADAQLYGLARLGLSGTGGSALAVLFQGRDPVTAMARGGVALPDGATVDAAAVAGLDVHTEVPHERWRVRLEHDAHGFDLAFEALGPPAAVSDAVARAGGMAGHEQLCGVRGTVRTDGRVHAVRCLGQRGHAWGEADWEHVERVRTLAAWPDGAPALALTAVRPTGVDDHASEPTWAAFMDSHGSVEVGNPRLTTTYDADGRQRRAGLELWVRPDDDFPRSGSGTVLCGSTIELGQLRLDCAFFRWHLDGRAGVGRYDTLTKAG